MARGRPSIYVLINTAVPESVAKVPAARLAHSRRSNFRARYNRDRSLAVFQIKSSAFLRNIPWANTLSVQPAFRVMTHQQILEYLKANEKSWSEDPNTGEGLGGSL